MRRFGTVRIRPWVTFAFVVVLLLLSSWIAVPGDNLNLFNIKTRTDTKLGLDLRGGLYAVLQTRPAPGQTVDKDVLSGLRDTIERRVNGLGVSEPNVQTQGTDKIVVELPGVQDPQQAVNVLQQTALLEFVGSATPLQEGQIVTTTKGGPETVGLNADGTPKSSTPGATTGGAAGATDPATGGTPAGSPAPTVGGTAAAVNTAGASAVAGTPIASGTPAPDLTATAGATGTPVAAGAAGSVAGTPDPNATPGAMSAMATPATSPTGPVYETIIEGKDLADAFPQTDQTGNLVVGFKLDGAAASKFGEWTQAHTGQYLAIVVDKRVISSPRINSRIDQNGQIEGLTRAEVQNLTVQLKSGRLAVPLDLIQTQTVGPTLGQDSINKSLIAGLIGLASVAFFMIVFYRLPGVLAVLALIVYAAITFAIFKLTGVVLTLAGIAGFILSIGLAVDANVLIFARMKEELRAGRNLRNAIDAGFDHAWPSIRDSNVSTTITCLILYVFGGITGTSVVRGFSLTLLIGVLVSLFSAITVTRTFLRLLLSSRAISRNRWLFNAESIMEAPIAARGAVAGD